MVVDGTLSTLQMCNSIANCFIYAKMHRHYRQHLQKFKLFSWTVRGQNMDNIDTSTSNNIKDDHHNIVLLHNVKTLDKNK